METSVNGTAHRVETGLEGTRLTIPSFGVPHVFGARGFPSDGAQRIDGLSVLTATQVHRADVYVVDGGSSDWAAQAAAVNQVEADALATDRAGVWIGVYTADCAPVLLYDPEHDAAAAVHAGWRGALMGVAPAAVQRMTARFAARPAQMEAAIGPHLGACCFEVGRAVVEPLSAQYPGWDRWITARRLEKGYFDLRAFLRWQLESAGIPSDRIHGIDLCTHCEPALLSSYRREGKRPQGMLSAIRVGNR